MKRIIVVSLFFLALGPGQVFAAECATSGTGHGTALTGDQLSSLVTGHYVYDSSSPHEWNELNSGGDMADYKLGPGNAKDPSDGIGTGLSGHYTGTYTISGTTGTGTIKYTYPVGGSEKDWYHVVTGGTANGTGSCLTGSPYTCVMGDTYAFCGVSGGTVTPPDELLTVNTTHG